MSGEHQKRRLVAILAADVVGYSRLMGRDEAGTLAALKRHRETLFNPAVATHNGRVVKLVGDGTLVEFASVVDAVTCAIAVQRSVAAEARPGPPSITLRIGVNLGDVIIDGDDIYGDGVNIAARLESLADPGGVCVSSIVNESVGSRVDATFSDAGEMTLKNVDRPVRVWKWHPERAQSVGEASRSTPAPEASLPLPEKPSIAVLPFRSMSGDPEQEHFADGLTADIITGLSRVRSLFVIARSSAFAYKGREVELAQVAQDLGVLYVLEGSLRRSRQRVRITAQLIEATTGRHVWAEKFDRELIEIFDLQDEITRNVVASTQTQIMIAEGDAGLGVQHQDLDVWRLVSRSMARIHDLTPDALVDAKRLAERALDIDPRCGAALRCVSIVLYHQAYMLTAATSAARPVAEAGAGLERAVEINPNFSTAVGSLGTTLCYVGRPEEGIELNVLAIRSDPLNPSIFFRHTGLALGYYLSGDNSNCVAWATKSIQRNPAWYLGHVYLLAGLGRLGRHEEAAAVLHDYLARYPAASIGELDRLPLKRAGDAERLRAGLRAAGLPD